MSKTLTLKLSDLHTSYRAGNIGLESVVQAASERAEALADTGSFEMDDDLDLRCMHEYVLGLFTVEEYNQFLIELIESVGPESAFSLDIPATERL